MRVSMMRVEGQEVDVREKRQGEEGYCSCSLVLYTDPPPHHEK